MFIYIPLCLYLYDISTPPVNSYYTIYIPLCLYLYLIFRNCCIHRFAFTFHYASTYTGTRTPERRTNLIYIPLCLYLYHEMCLPFLHFLLFTFHYASTYTKTGQHIHMQIVIYIPLCLYLYPRRTKKKEEPATIYIPLCLYLYIDMIEAIAKILNLHSTMPLLIQCKRKALRASHTFTFHYASTYTIYARLMRQSELIYIPLCLYLYPKAICYVSDWTIFTFHYASTYTELDVPYSTVYYIYIPLCLYLYLNPHNIMDPEVAHLHSTMPLLIL